MYVCMCNVDNNLCLSFLFPLLMFSQFPFYHLYVILCITSDSLSLPLPLPLSLCICLLLVFHNLWFDACRFASKQLTKKLWFIEKAMASFGGVVLRDPSLSTQFTQLELRKLKSQVLFIFFLKSLRWIL